MNLSEFETLNPDIGVVCTDHADWAREQLGNGEIWGFFDDDNPGTATGKCAGGHDFLVVDGRWIVDLWSKFVACISDRAVFDLDSESDAAEVKRLFGDREKWVLVSRNIT